MSFNKNILFAVISVALIIGITTLTHEQWLPGLLEFYDMNDEQQTDEHDHGSSKIVVAGNSIELSPQALENIRYKPLKTDG